METAAGRLLRMRNWNFFPIARKLIGRKAQDRHGIGRDWNIQVANIKGLMWPWALRDSPGRFSFNNSATAIGPWSFCCQVCFIRIPAICTGEGGGRGGRSSFFFIYFGFLKMFFILLFITSKRCAALCVIGDWKRAIDALSLSLFLCVIPASGSPFQVDVTTSASTSRLFNVLAWIMAQDASRCLAVLVHNAPTVLTMLRDSFEILFEILFKILWPSCENTAVFRPAPDLIRFNWANWVV